MSRASRHLDADRAARNKARRRFDTRFGQAKVAMTPSAITSRIAGQIKRHARDTFDDAVEIADENRTVVAGTIAALAIWFLRKPIISWLVSRLGVAELAENIADDGI